MPDTAPPSLVTPAIIDAPMDVHPTFGYAGRFAYEGSTITATPGAWSDPDGTPTVVGRWMDFDGLPLAPEDQLAFVITAGLTGAAWKETATQAGQSTIIYHDPFVEVVPTPSTPQINSIGAITGAYAAGSTLTKPAHTWSSPLDITIAGEWHKNGTATGVTTSTYSDTAEGDTLFWRETATDTVPQTGTTEGFSWREPVFLVGVSMEALATQMAAEVDALIDGKTGGTTQDLWGSYDAELGASYVTNGNPPLDRNPDFFAPSLVRQLTGVAAWKGPWGQYNCYTAITPRHVISCAHGSMGTTEVWFVHPETGEIHKNSVIRQVNDWGLWNGVIKPSSAPKQAMEADLQVGLLASELPEWVMKYPVIEMSLEYANRLIQSGNPPTLYITQGSAPPSRFPTSPYIWTPRGQKLCVSAVNHGDVSDAQRLLFRRYPLVNGDSGCPEFILVNGTLHLFRTFTSAGGDGGRLGRHLAYVNGLISRVDTSHNINTGYTLNLATNPFLGHKEPLLATDSPIELADGSLLTRNI